MLSCLKLNCLKPDYLKKWCWIIMASLSLSSPLMAQRFNSDEVDQLIVKYRADVRASMRAADIPVIAARSISNATGLSVAYKRPMAVNTGAHVLKLPYTMHIEQARWYAQQVMAQHPEIEYVEPDYRRYALRTTPNDLQFNEQWHLMAPEDFPGAANVVNAWDLTKGSADIVVAVLDEGITNHADLRPNLVGGSAATSGYDMVSFAEDSNDGDGRDADPSNPGVPVTANDNVRDSVWHGTHVGGIIAARPDNGRFIAGVGWNTRLSAVRILSFLGSGTLSDQVDGMLWAGGETILGVPANAHPAQVINLSIGTDSAQDCARTEQNAVETLVAKGVSVVVAAGNENRDVKHSAPANCVGVIAVTGVMPDGARAPYANYGALNDIAAPADNIFSTMNSGKRAPGADTQKADSGTSQSAPQVAGVLALMLAANTKLLDEAVVKRADLPGLLEDKLKQSARPFPTSIMGSAEANGCNDNLKTACVCTRATCGAGLLDAFQAVKAVSTAPIARVGEHRSVAAAARVNLEGSASSDDAYGGKITHYQWQQLSGESVVLSDAETATAGFTAPAAGQSDKALVFKLTVTDDVGLQSSDEVIITVPGTQNGRSGGGGSVSLLWLLSMAGLVLLHHRRKS